ncbi:hypothetical protein Ancab_022275 [Ancistrocladus abbreviatus]
MLPLLHSDIRTQALDLEEQSSVGSGLNAGPRGRRFQVKKHIKQGQGHEGGIFAVEAQQLLHPSDVGVKIEEVRLHDYKLYYYLHRFML